MDVDQRAKKIEEIIKNLSPANNYGEVGEEKIRTQVIAKFGGETLFRDMVTIKDRLKSRRSRYHSY